MDNHCMNKYEKLRVALRYWLLGKAQVDKAYFDAMDALEWGSTLHVGTRKDGVTPEFQHQIEIAHYIRTLPDLLFPAQTITAALLHDSTEDGYTTCDEVTRRYGHQVGQTVFRLDKRGKKTEEYFQQLATDPIGSVVKGSDRIHNMQSMVGVFTMNGQLHYIKEVKEHFLPMLKASRRLYPQQEPAYENIKHVLKSQVQLIEHIHAAKEEKH